MPPKTNRAMPVILLAIFLDLISNGILVPIVPQLLANPDSPYYLLPASVPISYAYIILGILIAIFPIILFFSTPILGEYSDHYGRRRILTLALSGTAVSFALFAFGVWWKSLTLLFVARIVGGLAGGNISVAQAAIADITPPEKRASQFGLIGAAYGFGFIIGPVLGALLSDKSILPFFGLSTPFWFVTGLSLLNALLIFIFLKETRRLTDVPKIAWKAAINHIFKAYNMKSIRAIFGTNFLFQSGITLMATFFSVFLIHSFDYDQVNVGYYIGYAGIWLIISQVFILRWVSKKWDEITILRFFLLAAALSILAYYIPEHTIGLLIVGAFFAVTNGIAMAALPSLASRRAGPEIQGEILGINGSVQALAQAAPPIIAGVLAAEMTPSAPILAAGIVIGISWVFFVLTVRREKTA
jgi:DHA1 family tetracycline resistance protein-like MFS transporter